MYQTGWFACVLSLAYQSQWIGVVIAFALLGTHVWLSNDRQLQVTLIVIFASFGLMLDSLQLRLGVFAFPVDGVLGSLPPVCILLLWMQFATTTRYSMIWLRKRYTLSALFGFVGGPLAYFAGERLGAIQFLSPRLFHYALVGCLWALSVPILIFVSDRLAMRYKARSTYVIPRRISHGERT